MSYKSRRTYGRRKDPLNMGGGSGDVNPQYMNLAAVQPAADTFAQVQYPVPIQRLQNSGRAQVMEVLKVFFQCSNIGNSAPGYTSATQSTILTTKSFPSPVGLAEPTCFASFEKSSQSAFTAAGTFKADQEEPYVFDCTDGAGHGVLIASDNIFIQLSSGNTGAVQSAQVKILYRWKDVSITEYVGIVQSQQ